MIRSKITLFSYIFLLCCILGTAPAHAAISPAVNTGSVLDDGPIPNKPTTPAKQSSTASTQQSPATGTGAKQPSSAATAQASAATASKANTSQKAAPAKQSTTSKSATKTTAKVSTSDTEAGRVARALASRDNTAYSTKIDQSWQALATRLKNDPQVPDSALRYFSVMAPYSPEPMGVKIRELFNSAFGKKKSTVKPRARVWRKLLTKGNMEKCNAFLAKYKSTFDAVEKKYPVPREILAALLFVETRFGNVIGQESALWSLACMAAATTPDKVQGGLGNIPITADHAAWLQTKLTDKSEWAYKELKSFLNFCNTQQLDPSCMPGSVYGAIGICQFMPSNLTPYGDDGDGDGIVNLFNEPDAIFSAAKYLTKHGWAAGITVERQRKTIKRYNNLNVYANTILALAESVRTGVLQSVPPDMKAEAAAVQPTSKKKKTAKKKAVSSKKATKKAISQKKK